METSSRNEVKYLRRRHFVYTIVLSAMLICSILQPILVYVLSSMNTQCYALIQLKRFLEIGLTSISIASYNSFATNNLLTIYAAVLSIILGMLWSKMKFYFEWLDVVDGGYPLHHQCNKYPFVEHQKWIFLISMLFFLGEPIISTLFTGSAYYSIFIIPVLLFYIFMISKSSLFNIRYYGNDRDGES